MTQISFEERFQLHLGKINTIVKNLKNQRKVKIILLLYSTQNTLTARQIVTELHIPQVAVYRHLKTLYFANMVQKTMDYPVKYRLSPMTRDFIELSNKICYERI